MNKLDIFYICYVTPTIISLVMLYFSKDVKTIRDYLNWIWVPICPVLNILMAVLGISEIYFKYVVPFLKLDKICYSIWDIWNRFLDLKIKR